MEKNEIDIKGTIANLIKEEEPEMTQEEAIMKYKEENQNAKKAGTSGEEAEDDEHLKRVKKELLASLERVKQLAKKIYEEKTPKSKTVAKEKQQVKAKELEKEEIQENTKDQERER